MFLVQPRLSLGLGLINIPELKIAELLLFSQGLEECEYKYVWEEWVNLG